jgi:predicted enzyme related to lactoylglutathione lyase
MYTGSENGRNEAGMRFIRMIPVTTIQKLSLVIPLMFLAVSSFAQSPSPKILYVGAIAINPCQDAKVLAEWYSRFGIETKEYKGGYYAQLDTASGPLFFAIHPKKADAPKKCSVSISVVFRVENFEASVSAAKTKGLLPDSTEKDPNEGQFAHFHDPDGNEVTLWGK